MSAHKLFGHDVLGFLVAVVASLPLLAGCAEPPGLDGEGDEAVEQARQAELSRNELSRNALSFNELSRNELSRNALSAGYLSSNALSTAGLGLQLIKYVVRCALDDKVCLDVPYTASDTDVPAECTGGVCHFCGNLNLAPTWLSGPLSLSQEKWMSACLLAHVNLDGVSVPISVRDAVTGNIPAAKPPESNQYDASEAAFFGNLFRPLPDGTYAKYSCNAGESDTPPGRLCGLDANGATSCAVTFVGSCAGYSISDGTAGAGVVADCGYVDALPNGAVRQCQDPLGGLWDEVITIYDHRVCGNGICSGSETVGNCPQDCKIK
jgi:hypothetical protein